MNKLSDHVAENALIETIKNLAASIRDDAALKGEITKLMLGAYDQKLIDGKPDTINRILREGLRTPP